MAFASCCKDNGSKRDEWSLAPAFLIQAKAFQPAQVHDVCASNYCDRVVLRLRCASAERIL